MEGGREEREGKEEGDEGVMLMKKRKRSERR